MSRSLQILKIFLIIALITSANVAVGTVTTDNGTDQNGDLIVSPTLALRCSISSQEPNITEDCIERLAYDYKSGKLADEKFSNYKEMRKAIVSEYVAAYFENAIKQLVSASGYKDRIEKEFCINSSDPSCAGLSKDISEEIGYNNKLATDNAAILLDAVKLRSQDLNFNAVEVMLDKIVPAKEVDLENKSLAGPP